MQIRDLLWVLLYFEDDVWNAHALDLDLVGSGATASKAWEELKDAIFTQLAFAIQNAVIDGIEHPAPEEYWARLKDAQGLLESNLVEGLELHSNLMDLRHKAFAHTDASGRLPGQGMMTEVRLLFEGGSVVNFSSRPVLEPELLPHIKTLSDLLTQKVQEVHDKFYDRVLKAIVPRFGIADIGKEFELNVQDEKGPMVVPAADPIRHKYPVVRHLPESN